MTTPARLHHERLGPADATRLVLFTHGIYGSGTNWRAIARQVVARAPGWAAVLVDLRLHGRSTAGEPPHTVAACVDDLAALCAALAAAGPPVVAAVGSLVRINGSSGPANRKVPAAYRLEGPPSTVRGKAPAAP